MLSASWQGVTGLLEAVTAWSFTVSEGQIPEPGASCLPALFPHTEEEKGHIATWYNASRHCALWATWPVQ